MGRVILHVDANHFYAAVEIVYAPELRNKPVIVGGDVEKRHGIVLTKNPIAKKYGIETGEALWQAKQKCPGLVCIPPNYPLYIRFSARMHRLFEEYSDKVESFGLDEAFIDLTQPGMDIVEGERIAHEIRTRVKERLGITVSVGVSFNKVFAKLGSDMRKPDAVTVIPEETFRERIWRLPASDLLYVGRSTSRRLKQINVYTIGDLATVDMGLLKLTRLGKNGLILKAYANGLDNSPVMPTGYQMAIKSVGNSATPPHDLICIRDVKCLFYLLSEAVATRLRQNGFRARRVSISVRSTTLVSTSHQMTLRQSTNIADEIAQAAMQLFNERYANAYPFRSAGISCSLLSPDTDPVQLDYLGDEEHRMRLESLESALDGVRSRFGQRIVQRGIVLTDTDYAQINPVDDHTIHPVAFYTG